jgi:hypothetical protein
MEQDLLQLFMMVYIEPQIQTTNNCNFCQSKRATGHVLDFNPTGTHAITMNAGVGGPDAVAYVPMCIEYYG